MPKLLFFSRVAFLCNICFLVAFLMHYMSTAYNGVVPATIIILGNVLAILINFMLNILTILLFLAGRVRMAGVPVWLISINFMFFVLQVIFLMK